MKSLTRKDVEDLGFRIEKKVVGHAYAKSGNAHNPTPRVMWTIFSPDGTMLTTGHGRLKTALGVVEETEEGQALRRSK